MRNVVTLSVLSVFLVACAANDEVKVASEEPIKYIDLTLDEQKELVKEYWVVEKRQEPRYPVSAARDGLSGCVDLIVGIKSDGKAGGYKVKKSYPEGVFDEYAAAALTNWLWVPTDKNSAHAPVLTRIQLDFMVSGARNTTEAESQCGVSHIL